MKIPFVFFIISLAVSLVALAKPDLSNVILLSGPCALASLVLWLRAWLRPSQPSSSDKQNCVVIDGSNVMHWRKGIPSIEPVVETIRNLEVSGYTPGVVFDANAGHLLAGRYLHDNDFEKILKLPRHRVMVAHKGTSADPLVLTAARTLSARIVSNDRFRDWIAAYPEISDPGHIIRGGYRSGKVWLNLDAPDTAAQSQPQTTA
ncbi:hypothetical protein SuNHUV7_07620 (plasmid) [Pseudoseohaeicola sp. NH-UV-7]|uniref:NYN domain-containing protein n=1 Tax=Sulfitobacter sp. TBRI5 TaxID=2989732 RepID=UPI003A6A3556